MFMITCLSSSVFFTMLNCPARMRLVLLCCVALYKNKWPLPHFNYNGKYAKAPHLLFCFCSASGGSGFGVFNG